MWMENWNKTNSCLRVFYKKDVLKNFAEIPKKTICWSLSIKFQAATSVKVKRNDLKQVFSSQKQPPVVFCKKRVLKSFHRKTPVLGSLFNIVVGLQAFNFIIKRLQHKCFPVNIAKLLRTPVLKNICEQLLLSSKFCGMFHNSR